MMETVNTPTSCEDRDAAGLTPGEAATRRWIPDEAELQQRIDALVREVTSGNACESTCREQSLFAASTGFACQPRRRSMPLTLNHLTSRVFLAMIRSLPEDHVVIEPTANNEFISRCRIFGATASEFVLNKSLMNVRKAGQLHRGIQRGTAPTLSRDVFDSVGYAAEIAAKLVQVQTLGSCGYCPTVDRLLCDPSLRQIFDGAARSIAPGFSLYEYRLAAFTYRKSSRESTMRLGRTETPEWDVTGASFRELDLDDAPEAPGVYRIDAGHRSLFVSATLNLRGRLMAHLAAGDRVALLPPSLWDPPKGRLVVRWFRAPLQWRPRRIDAVAQRMKAQQGGSYNLSYASVG